MRHHRLPRVAASLAALALVAAPAHAQRVTTGLFGAISYAPATSEKHVGGGLSVAIPVISRFSLEMELAEMLGGAAADSLTPVTATPTPSSATFDYHVHGTFGFPLGPRAELAVGPGMAFSASAAERQFGASLSTALTMRITRLATLDLALVTDHFGSAPAFVQTVHAGLQIGWRFSPVAAEDETEVAEPKRAVKPAPRAAARPAAKPVTKPAPKPAPRPAPRPAAVAETEPVEPAAVEPQPVVERVAPKPVAAPAAPVAAPTPPPAVAPADSATIARPIFFGTGSARLDANALQTLRERAEVLARYPDARLRIVGHSDVRGSRHDNDVLAVKRARAVLAELRRLGVAADRLDAEGEGAAHPVATGHDAASYARNRRSELVLHVGPTSMPACVTVPAGADAAAVAEAARDGRPACVAKRYY